FHIPPTKEDFRILPHLGHLESSYRNPKTIHPMLSSVAITINVIPSPLI
ncbi:YkyB family protein, partial [Bacillus sp. D-CC]